MCALFGSSRDISLFKKISSELVDDIIQQEVSYYKYHLEETKGTKAGQLYGEASAQRTYYRPIQITCIAETAGQTTAQDDQFGIDILQTIILKFLTQKLRDLNLVPRLGDIVEFRGFYYEMDQIVENQLIVGKDYDYGGSVGPEFGESYSLVCTLHQTKHSKLQITNNRY